MKLLVADNIALPGIDYLISQETPKTLICLHGLGQTSQVWASVLANVKTVNPICLDLFEDGRLPNQFSVLTDKVEEVLAKSTSPVILVGLSLGAMVALSVLQHPKVAGAIVIAPQYRFKRNKAYQIQFCLFKLIPSWFFKRQGMDKTNLKAFYESLADFDLTEELNGCSKPVLLLCGDRDKINHKASKELMDWLDNGYFEVIANSGHEMITDQPIQLARRIESFLKEY